MIVIGITGTIGAGKGVTVSYLEKKGFAHYSVRGFLNEELTKQGKELTRDNMLILANELRRDHEPSYIIQRLFEKAQKAGKNCVIESVRALGEVDFLRKQKDFILLAVDADERTRYERIVKRNSSSDHVSFEKFVEDNKKEMTVKDRSKSNIAECMKVADYHLKNDGRFEELYIQIDNVLGKIIK